MKQFYFVIIPEKWTRIDNDPGSPNIGKIASIRSDFSFRTYTDTAGALQQGTGRSVQFTTSRDQRGLDRGKFFKISQQHNAILCNDTDRDLNGVLMFDFIKNHPNCLGSPNGTYVIDDEGNKVHANALFKLMDSEGDAEVALEASMNSARAVVSVDEIDEQTLSEVAGVALGMYGKPDKMMKHALVEWARKNPNDYFKHLKSGDRFLRAIVRKAIADGIFTVKGSLIFWNETMIGTDEDSAIKTLVDDQKMLEGLKEKVNLREEAKNAKKGPGRPRKN